MLHYWSIRNKKLDKSLEDPSNFLGLSNVTYYLNPGALVLALANSMDDRFYAWDAALLYLFANSSKHSDSVALSLILTTSLNMF